MYSYTTIYKSELFTVQRYSAHGSSDVEYIVSDDMHSYTTWDKPQLNDEALAQDMREYLMMRDDSIREDVDD